MGAKSTQKDDEAMPGNFPTSYPRMTTSICDEACCPLAKRTAHTVVNIAYVRNRLAQIAGNLNDVRAVSLPSRRLLQLS
jgi:hypothetical protein